MQTLQTPFRRKTITCCDLNLAALWEVEGTLDQHGTLQRTLTQKKLIVGIGLLIIGKTKLKDKCTAE